MDANEVERENEALRAKLLEVESKLAEAQDVIRAIQSGDVDAVVVSGPEGERVFTLKDAEYAYRALIEAMNEGAATLDADGTVLYCNQRFADLVGLPLEQVIGRPSTRLFAGETERAFQSLFAHALRGDAVTSEIELHSPDGRYMPAHVSVRQMNTEGPTALCMVLTDLTEHKRRDELIAAGKLATSILESAAEAIAVCDETGKIIMANGALEALSGFNPLFQPFENALPLEVIGEVGEPFQPFSIRAALTGTVPRAREVRFRRRDGQVFSLLLSSGWITGSDGVAGCVLTMTDITERKRAEDALRESEARFRALFDNSPDAVFLTIPNGQILAANPAACTIFGMSEEEICRAGRQRLVDTDDSRYRAAEEERQRTKRPIKAELTFTRRNGERFPGEMDSVILPGSPVRSFVVVRDITARKLAEQALIQSEKLASVGRMASTIAHEINNPLETIGHALYLVSTDPGTSDKAKSYLAMADQELERVTHIAKQTLAFHRENTKPSLVDLRERLDGTLNLFAPRLKSRGVTVEKRYADVGQVNAAAGEIRQIIANLLSNSMDAMPKDGTIRFHISRAIDRNGRSGVRLSIADTGSGISPERLKKIFDPFFTTKEVVGTGLGLWVTKQILEKYGASIRVRSKPTRGTVFSIVFPCADENTPAR